MDGVQQILPDYNLYQLYVEPEDCGHRGVNRRRTYIYCCHRETGVYLHDLYELYKSITKLIKKTVATQCQDYFVATELARKVHLREICHTRKLKHKPIPESRAIINY